VPDKTTQTLDAPATDAELAELPDDDALARADAKPPAYRLFRGAMYVTYLVVVVWFCLSIVIGVWRSVYAN